MKTTVTLAVLTSGCLLLAPAHAQTAIRFGPRVGLELATAHFQETPGLVSVSSRWGVEAGLSANVQVGRLAVQPSVLFSQKGYQSMGNLTGFEIFGRYEETTRLNYVTVPLNFAVALGRDGQGLQVFAGPYVGVLVGGHYARQEHASDYPGAPTRTAESTGRVRAGSEYDDYGHYSKRVDGGVQAGLGYRFHGALVQAGYSVGLRALNAQFRSGTYTAADPVYYNRAFQVSLTYLVDPKK
jgi:hypothetical protein